MSVQRRGIGKVIEYRIPSRIFLQAGNDVRQGFYVNGRKVEFAFGSFFEGELFRWRTKLRVDIVAIAAWVDTIPASVFKEDCIQAVQAKWWPTAFDA